MANKKEKFWGKLIGAAVGVIAGVNYAKGKNTEEEKLLAAVIGGSIGLGSGLLTVEFFGEPKDTINYILYDGKKRVYDGITYEDRANTRKREHRKSGKKFTRMVKGEVLPRSEAEELEYQRIKRNKAKYNIQHNS